MSDVKPSSNMLHTVAEVVVILLIIVLIFGGWYLWNTKTEKDQTKTQSTEPEIPIAADMPAPPPGNKKAFSLRKPTNCNQTHDLASIVRTSVVVRFDANDRSSENNQTLQVARWRPVAGDVDAWTLHAAAGQASRFTIDGRNGVFLDPKTVLGTVKDMPRSLFGCHVFVVATMHDVTRTGQRTLVAQRGATNGIMLRLEGNKMCRMG